MLYNGFYLGFEEGVPTGMVIQLSQFFDKHRASVDSAIQGFQGGFRCTAWLVEQSQFSLAVRTVFKHLVGFMSDDVKIRKSSETTNKTMYFLVSIFLKIQTNTDKNRQIRTLTDISGQMRTLRLRDVVYLHGKRKMIRLNRVRKYVGPKQDDTSFREHEYS